MPVRDTSALSDWAAREKPTPEVWAAVSMWVAFLEDSPWPAPSTPFPELSDFPNYETRSAEIPGTDGVEVFYRREFAGEVIDLIWVGQMSSPA